MSYSIMSYFKSASLFKSRANTDSRLKAKILITAVVSVMLAIFGTILLFGCSSGSIAATVNGSPIYENDVTEYIEGLRERLGLEDDASWAQWLVSSGKGTEEERENAINYLVRETVIEQDAEDKGIGVSDEDVETKIADVMEHYGCEDDPAFAEILKGMNYTPETYKDFLRQSLFQERIIEFLGDDAPTNWEEYVSGLISGAQVEVFDMSEDLPYAVDIDMNGDEKRNMNEEDSTD